MHDQFGQDSARRSRLRITPVISFRTTQGDGGLYGGSFSVQRTVTWGPTPAPPSELCGSRQSRCTERSPAQAKSPMRRARRMAVVPSRV